MKKHAGKRKHRNATGMIWFFAIVALFFLVASVASQNSSLGKYTLAIGESVEIGEGIIAVVDLSPNKAAIIDIKLAGQDIPRSLFLKEGERRIVGGIEVFLESLQVSREYSFATISISKVSEGVQVGPSEISSDEAVKAFKDAYPQYPSSSIQVTRGACPRSGASCWVVSGYKKAELSATDGIPSASYLFGTVAYVNGNGIDYAVDTN